MNRLQALTLGVLAIALTGCSIIFGGGFEPNVVIPTTEYRIDNLRCEAQPGRTNVDGESIDDMHWIVRGEFVNTLSSGSKNYEVRVNVLFSDGTEIMGSDLVFPLASGDSFEFAGFLGGQVNFEDPNATITECSDVTVFDSVLNH